MKTIFIALILSVSFYSFGQNRNTQKLLPDNYFSEQLDNKRLPYSFDISPEFQEEIPVPKFDFSYPLPEIQQHGEESDNQLLNDNTTYFSSRMPVLKSDFQSNMPIAIPDSSVHYFILNKKIEVVNPLERKE
jgi:hypothetical protein